MTRHVEQNLRRGKRYVQKEKPAVRHAERAQRVRERNQVIVVHPPDHVVRPEQRREPAIHAAIAIVLVAIELDQVRAIVKRRPERRVGETVVVLVIVALDETDGRERHRPVLFQPDVLGRRVEHVAAPAEPHAAGFLQRIVDTDREAARRRAAFGNRRTRFETMIRRPIRRVSPPCPR